jgi:hypothetical protein
MRATRHAKTPSKKSPEHVGAIVEARNAAGAKT